MMCPGLVGVVTLLALQMALWVLLKLSGSRAILFFAVR